MTLVHRSARGIRRLLAVLALALGSGGVLAQGLPVSTCFGRFINPITDICWQCIFPISIGALPLTLFQEDIENPASPLCACPMPAPPWIRVGISVGFWEPARLIETTRTPFCFPALGGSYLGLPAAVMPSGAYSSTASSKVSRDSFYQVHMYLNPIMFYLEVLVDTVCLEIGSFDLAYMSEFDPSWHDDVMTAIIEPEAIVFANLVAQAACAADCVAASVGFGIRELFWCSGCNGPVYPMSGNVPTHIGGVQASALLNHRILAKMHRLMISWQWWGTGAMCHGFPAPLMDKRGYKAQMVYPVPMVIGGDHTNPLRCCQPLGRTTQVWGMGREFPIRGEDWAYQIFRKRNCCAF